MNNDLPRKLIKDLELESSDEITLHLELIRIIEKDIDDIKDSNSKSGWTSWAIIGAIVGGLSLLFGETRNLKAFPVADTGQLILLVTLALHLASSVIRLLGATNTDVKPGRVRWSNEADAFYLPTAVYKLIVFVLCAVIAFSLALPLTLKVLAIIPFLFLALTSILIISLILKRLPLGRPSLKNRWTLGFVLANLLLPLPALIWLINRQLPPVGEMTSPYILAGVIIGIVWLAERLISTTVPSRLLSNLTDLRNDIIFLRADVDEALRRYEIITEGETLPDALQKELSDVLNNLSTIYNAQTMMSELLRRMVESIPKAEDDKETIRQKFEQIRLDRASYALHMNNYNGVIASELKDRLGKLATNMTLVRNASEDLNSANMVEAELQQRLNLLGASENRLNEIIQDIDKFLANPTQIPPTLSQLISNMKKSDNENGLDAT